MKWLLARASRIAPLRGWCVVGLIFVVVVGISVGGWWHWGPDTRYYLALTYHYGGLSEHEAGMRTFEFLSRFPWYNDYCHTACDPHSAEASFDHLFHGHAAGMVATRVVYPVLSIPFVWLIGPQGMLVVPFVAFIACVVLLMAFVSRTIGREWSVLAAAMLLVPATISNYVIYAYTESLSMCLVMACIMVMPVARATTRRHVAIFAGLLFLVALTRQFHLVVVAAVLLTWVGVAVAQRTLRNQWLPYAVASIVVLLASMVVQSLFGPDYSPVKTFKDLTGAQTNADIPGAVVTVAINLVKKEIWYIGHEVPLAVICAAAVVAMLYRFLSPVALLTLGAVLGTFVLNIINTEPSNFRYYVTAFPFIAIAATAVIAELLQPSKENPETRPNLARFGRIRVSPNPERDAGGEDVVAADGRKLGPEAEGEPAPHPVAV